MAPDGHKMCYNKGCGKTFDPTSNNKDSCMFHSGEPVFHDAYKGWSCCNKKTTDFTEFLNIKGCTVSFHNSDKPPEPEKPVLDDAPYDEIIEVRPPQPEAMDRPSFDMPMIEMKPKIASNLIEQVKLLSISSIQTSSDNSTIPIGTKCKNNGCKQSYEGPQSLEAICVYHPGYPVFHEGLKFWTCCTKRTTDFSAFLEQEGCDQGKHLWFKKAGEKGQVKCRLDWHQTGSSVVVSIFGKKYDPYKSRVQLSPVRLKIDLYFPEEDGYYQNDIELKGIVNVDKSSIAMLATKVEINLNKAEIGSWSKLEIPKIKTVEPDVDKEAEEEEKRLKEAQHIVDTVDLSDL